MATRKAITIADKMEKKFTSALKKSTTEKNTLPVIVRNGVKVKMPLELVLMRASFSKVQLNIIVTVLKTIGKKVNEIIENKMKNGDIMSLFPASEFGENENCIQFVIRRKDFGIPSSHIEELKGALRLMRIIPVDLPVTGKVTGVQYTKYTNLCSVTLPDDGFKDYCIVEMSRQVASHILHEDIRYATIVDSISRKLRSKYSIRIYWIVMLYAYRGGITFDYAEFKKQICGSEPKYDRYAHFESEVLHKARKDIFELYKQGLCEYCFDYHPTKEDRKNSKEKGNPDTIIFTITKQKLRELESQQNDMLSFDLDDNSLGKQRRDIEDSLLSKFGISKKRVEIIISKITEENIEAFKQKISILQAKKIDKPTMSGGFFAVALDNFFKEYNTTVASSKTEDIDAEAATSEVDGTVVNSDNPESHDQKYYRKCWYQCQDELKASAQSTQSDLRSIFLDLIDCLIYEKYSIETQSVIVIVPTLFIIEFIEKNLEPFIEEIIHRCFDEKTKLELTYRGFQGKDLTGKAEKIKRYADSMEIMKQAAREVKEKDEKEQEQQAHMSKCINDWQNCLNEFFSMYNSDDTKRFFDEYVQFQSFDSLKHELILAVANRRVFDTIEERYVEELIKVVNKYFGEVELNYRLMERSEPFGEYN